MKLPSLFKRCKHENVRCIHGDEILMVMKGLIRTKIARVRCIDCQTPLYDWDMLEVCSDTNEPHHSLHIPRTPRSKAA